MSDDEDFMMEDGGFEYEDSEGEEEEDTGFENRYYTAKGLKSSKPDTAIEQFESIAKDESPQGDWGFKSLKQITKLTFRLKRYQQSLDAYTRLLPYTKSAVTRNYAEKSINSVLDYVSASNDIDTTLMQTFYDETNRSLAEARNDRLSTKTNLKLAKLWLDRKEYSRLNKIIAELKDSMGSPDDDSQDNTSSNLLLEVLAVEIQMYNETKNTKKLREIYDQTLTVKSAITHPKIMGVIRECGGKMHMSEKEWSKAQVDFFESFRNYDEAGSMQRTQVLKYLVLAHMLMGSEIDPFDSQETKPYKNNPEIVAMTALVAAYQKREVHEAEKILRENRSTIMDDPFIREHIDEVIKSLRTSWILDILKPYTRIEINYLARQLGISDDEVEDILITLILDNKVKGRLDQVTGQLELESHKQIDTTRYNALSTWSKEIQNLNRLVLAKVNSSGPAPIAGMPVMYDQGMVPFDMY